jgi:tetratricopeptide (TPR) repeat protein
VNSHTKQLPTDAEIGRLVALLNAGRLADAESQTRIALRSFPEMGMLWKILSVALLRQGRDALPALRRAAELLPDDVEAQGNLGSMLHDRGLWSEALGTLTRVLELRSNDVEAQIAVGDSLQKLGRLEEAIRYYHQALRLDTSNHRARNNLGNAFLALGRHADAVGYYRLALELNPRDPIILCNLARAQMRLKFTDEALENVRAALALDSGLVAAHNTLGMILAAQGAREAAMSSFQQALVLDSSDVDALNGLANLLRELGYRRDAVALFARAVKGDPTRAESHSNLGMALFEMRQIDDAVSAFQHALTLNPKYAPAHLNLSLAFRQLRRPADAEASCQAALAIKPDYVDALAFLGELKADRGQFAEAQALFQQATALDPNYAPAVASTATHRKMTSHDSDWARHAESLLQKPLPLQHQIGLRYALGKYFDEIGNYAAAFQHVSLANELGKRLTRPYDAAQFAGTVDKISSIFKAALLGGPSRSDDISSPIIIVGMPRSGTSLAEQILASHPQAFGAGEVVFWNTAFERVLQALDVGADPSAGFRQAARDYLAQLATISGAAPRVIDKLPANFLYAGLIHQVLPQARIIHMRRHPLDTCLSIYFQNFFNIGPFANDLEHLAHYFRQYLRITDLWRSTLPASSYLEVPYEALIDDQEAWTRRMLEFVDLPWEPRCLDFHHTERVVITASKWQVRQKLSRASIGRWRNYADFIGPLHQLTASPT